MIDQIFLAMLRSGVVKDASWASFPEFLRSAMQLNRLSSPDLAARLSDERVTASTVRKWRTGESHPPLNLIPMLASALDVEAEEIAAELGILDRSRKTAVRTELALRLPRLEAEIHRLSEVIVRAESNNGQAALVSAVEASDEWALGIWPAYEGPKAYRVHSADRLLLLRTDKRVAHESQLPASIVAALDGLHASTSRAPGWDQVTNGKGLAYSIQVHTRPHPPAASRNELEVAPSVLVLSTTVRAWERSVAAHLADALGFGLTSSRDIASIVADEHINRTRSWSQYAERLIEVPPESYVYSHSESSGVKDSRTRKALQRRLETSSLVVWLKEDDALIDHAVQYRNPRYEGWTAEEDRARTIRHRDEITEMLEARTSRRTIVIPLSLPIAATPLTDPHSLREENVERSIATAALVLQAIVSDHGVSIDELAGQDSVAVRWLREHTTADSTAPPRQ